MFVDNFFWPIHFKAKNTSNQFVTVEQREEYNDIDEMDIRLLRLHFNSVLVLFASNKIPLREFF